jgi:membrane protein DedA with SNARE-associated domain
MPGVGEWEALLGGAPWGLLALYALAAVDGVLPPVPSEGAVIALAALGASGGGPDLWLVGAVAAAGALTGDLVAYALGRQVPAGRLQALRWRGVGRAVCWAEGALAERGAAVVLGARFLPGVRVAVNVTAGAVGFPRVRFAGLAAVAAVAWAVCSVLLGVGAGRLLAGHPPVLRVAAGVVVGAVLGAALDRVLRWRGARRASSGAAGRAADG